MYRFLLHIYQNLIPQQVCLIFCNQTFLQKKLSVADLSFLYFPATIFLSTLTPKFYVALTGTSSLISGLILVSQATCLRNFHFETTEEEWLGVMEIVINAKEKNKGQNCSKLFHRKKWSVGKTSVPSFFLKSLCDSFLGICGICT